MNSKYIVASTLSTLICASTLLAQVNTKKWARLRDQRSGLDLRYPSGATIHRRSDRNYDYLRIQNYGGDDDLKPQEFLIEVFVMTGSQRTRAQDCSSIPKATAVKVGTLDGYRGPAGETVEGEGFVEFLCVDTSTKRYRINATGSRQDMSLVKSILDSVRLIGLR